MKFDAEIIIKPRKGILDTQGKAVEKSLINQGYTTINSVRIGRFITMNIEASDKAEAKSLIDSMCQDLLANDLIETYEIIIKEN